MKFRVAEPCPHCECRCEEYNTVTNYIGCPACERPRESSIANGERYIPLINWKLEYENLVDLIHGIGRHVKQ
jgi:hypothetical protein